MTMYGTPSMASTSDLKQGVKILTGLVGRGVDRALEPVERGVAYAADYYSDKGMEPVAAAFRTAAPAVLGLRAMNANLTSDGGNNFTPLPRDERHFSQSALENISDNLALHGGTHTERFAPLRGNMRDMSWWESSQGLGGSRIKDGAVTDVFDINKGEPGEKILSALFGSSSAPDAGKIATRIPLDMLPDPRQTRQDANGGSTVDAPKDYTAHSESTAPTDEQLEEAVEFLETVMEVGAPQNQWEQQAVKRIHDVLVATLENGQRVNSGEQPEPPQDENGTVVGDVGGGEVNEDEEERLRQVALATPTQGFGHSAEDRGAVDSAIRNAGGTPFSEGKTGYLSENSTGVSSDQRSDTTGRIGVQGRPTMNGPSISSGRIGVQGRPTMNGPSISSGRIGVQGRPTMNGPSISSGRIGVQGKLSMNGSSINSGHIGVAKDDHEML